jgi:hypothetical protein
MVAGPHCGDVSVIRVTYRAHAGVGSRTLRVRTVLIGRLKPVRKQVEGLVIDDWLDDPIINHQSSINNLYAVKSCFENWYFFIRSCKVGRVMPSSLAAWVMFPLFRSSASVTTFFST